MLKKLIPSVLLIAMFSFVTPIFAEGDVTVPEDVVADEETTVGEESETTIEVTNDSVYTIFVHEDCQHCQKVERFVTNNGLEGNVRYMELKNNALNLQALEEIWEENSIPESDRGWPFMITSEVPFRYAVGDQPIIDFFEENLADVIAAYDGPEDSGLDSTPTSNGLLILGGLVVLSVLGYGIYALMGSSEV